MNAFMSINKCNCIQIIIVMHSIIRYTKDIALLFTDIKKAEEMIENFCTERGYLIQ